MLGKEDDLDPKEDDLIVKEDNLLAKEDDVNGKECGEIGREDDLPGKDSTLKTTHFETIGNQFGRKSPEHNNKTNNWRKTTNGKYH